MWSCYVVMQALQHNAFLEPNLAHNNVITIDTTIDTERNIGVGPNSRVDIKLTFLSKVDLKKYLKII